MGCRHNYLKYLILRTLVYATNKSREEIKDICIQLEAKTLEELEQTYRELLRKGSKMGDSNG